MYYKGATRFAGNTSKELEQYRNTADSYPRLLSEDEKLGFLQKPFDWQSGHPSFLYNMYQLLNGIQAMKLEPGATIVEVGSGAGWVTEILVCLKYKIICVEPSNVMMEAAKKRVTNFIKSHAMPELTHSVKYVCKTLEELELPENSADAVLFFESFHHIVDEHSSIEKIGDFLKPQGVLCILGDSNWTPGCREQENFWEEEMRRFGTLESPFTHNYLIELLKFHNFGSVTRHHSVNALIPVEEENSPVVNFSGPLHANYVNLFTAKNQKGEMPCEHVENFRSAEDPTTIGICTNSSQILDAHPTANPQANVGEVKSAENRLAFVALLVKKHSPKLFMPALTWIWHRFLRPQ